MFLEAGILTRRSIRKFVADKEVTDEAIDDLLKLAMYAPSAMNRQSWEFVVIKDIDVRRKLAEICPNAQFVTEAPLAIVVCSDTNKAYEGGYWVLDATAATENLLLACHGRGLGACWCGVYPREERMQQMAGVLNLPEGVKPLSLVVIGYPRERAQQPQDRFDTNKIHYNKW